MLHRNEAGSEQFLGLAKTQPAELDFTSHARQATCNHSDRPLLALGRHLSVKAPDQHQQYDH